MNINNKKLYIVAGAAGEIGTQFCKTLVETGVVIIAVVRNTALGALGIDYPNIKQVRCDLSDAGSIETAFARFDFSLYDSVTFLHTIGTDKYNPRGYPVIQKMETLDPDVYDTNVNTFKYPLRYLLDVISKNRNNSGKEIKFKIVLLGGIADKFAPFVIEPFCEAKNICRQYIRSAVNLFPEWVSGLEINVSSTITKSALNVRPFADLKYWLTPEEVVRRSVDALMADTPLHKEIEIFKYSPEFEVGYYEDNEALYQKWNRETGEGV